ncbi:zinc finger HIT domain-containing protein 3-like [Amphiura filiformis]|uniref:zinc finger HIT domain-containing protein 3-like n=1 Tax=Amphiura filiformis TaxID=82378 RepID=UPI003B20DD14
MPSITGPCDVCLDEPSKYRCPICGISYCSLNCYKGHKETCKPEENQVSQTATTCDNATRNTSHKEPVEKEDGEISSEEEIEKEEYMVDEDRVPLEILQQLGKSEELKSLLHNPHLRQVLSHLDQTDNKEKAIADAMQEPLFTEFADQCLKIARKELEE